MQPNLLRNLCFLPTKNTKYRTFYRTHFLLISITCLSRYISLSFYRPALIQANVSALAPRPDGWHLTFLGSRDGGGRNEPAYAPWHGALCRKIKTWLSLTASLRAEPIHHPGYRGDWSKVSSISSLCYFLSQSPREARKRRANTIICTETVQTPNHSRHIYTSDWLENRFSMQRMMR